VARLPEWVRVKGRSKLCFRISREMVEAFAVWTGDRSALHVSDEFARRSLYRTPVVHGMLPVAFLVMVEGLDVAGKSARLTAIEAQFQAPVHLAELLDLAVEPSASQESDTEIIFEFRILKRDSCAPVTTGTFTVLYEDAPRAIPAGDMACDGGAPCVVTVPLAPNDLQIEDLSAGNSEGFDFLIGSASLDKFIEILIEGIEDRNLRPSAEFVVSFLPNQVAIALFSTFVGMRIPGKSATFLSFSAQVNERIRCGQLYHLKGTINHVSRSTSIIKSSIMINQKGRADGEMSIRGRITTLVNRRLHAMPTAKELKRSGMDWGLKDKVVLITGASRGIGETTAKLFGLYGAKVVVNFYRGKTDAGRIVDEIVQEGGAAVAIAADVTRSDDVQHMVNHVMAQYGAIHVLVNNAVRDYRPTSFLQLTWEDVQKDVDVIVKGAFHCCKAVMPGMLGQGGGKIINISTIAVDDPPPDQLKYVLAKSALLGLTRSLAAEFASKNIQVNTVVPSFVETDLVAHIQDNFRKKIAQESPMQRHASPVDVAHAVLFLASRFSSYTTGQRIMVTGGRPPFL
jgi:3-oxoacyl-[acyl-carrier protein] reductase